MVRVNDSARNDLKCLLKGRKTEKNYLYSIFSYLYSIFVHIYSIFPCFYYIIAYLHPIIFLFVFNLFITIL